MKNFYDLKKEEQSKLKKEFRKKWGSIKKGLIVGICLAIPYLGIICLSFNATNEDLYHSVTVLFLIVVFIVIIVLAIIEEKAFKAWLKSRNILK